LTRQTVSGVTSALKRDLWPTPQERRAPQPDGKGAGLMNSEVIFCAPGVLSATPLIYFLRRDDSDFVLLS
jgi:hypothetical protein